MEFKETKVKNFINAYQKLKAVAERYDRNDDIVRDSVIQRFEFTYETSWKCLQVILAEMGVSGVNAPRLVFRKAYSAGYIDDEEVWLSIIKDRNFTSHEYSEDESIRICDRIVSVYVEEFKKLTDMVGKIIAEG